VIIPEIEYEEDSDYISYTKFEPYMLKVMREKEFEPDEPEILMAAFKLLDVEEKGYIELDIIKNTL
jgi:Ca2+-binding EF-hand superfamily protein